jgi:CHAD domain-containing protein
MVDGHRFVILGEPRNTSVRNIAAARSSGRNPRSRILRIPKYATTAFWVFLSAAKSFPERHPGQVKSLEKKLGAFLDDPNEKNLHDLRTAVRRADASMAALPKSFRKSPKTKKLLGRLKKLMKSSAKVRDCDTVKTRLSSYPRDSVLDRLVKRVEKKRKRLLKSTEALAAKVREVSPLSSARDSLEEGKTERRLDKTVKRLEFKINRALPIVLSQPDNKEALHDLRKDCKRLRYTLEFSLAEPEESREVRTLLSWQDLLGAVRDGDVTIDYLEGLEKSIDVEKILAGERRGRSHDYERFTEACEKVSDARIGS